MKILAVAPFALFSAAISSAQTVADAKWLAGRWIGEGLGGVVEETWAPGFGGQMVGHFRLVKDGKPQFYEIMLIDEQPTGLRLRVKHFNPDFTGWEEKGAWQTFEPISVTPNLLKFHGLTIERKGDTATFVTAIRQKDGKVGQFKLTMRRAPL